ncbi:MAG: hypothetical protein AABX16_03330 [Nanoarchaeota archaeon]
MQYTVQLFASTNDVTLEKFVPIATVDELVNPLSVEYQQLPGLISEYV